MQSISEPSILLFLEWARVNELHDLEEITEHELHRYASLFIEQSHLPPSLADWIRREPLTRFVKDYSAEGCLATMRRWYRKTFPENALSAGNPFRRYLDVPYKGVFFFDYPGDDRIANFLHAHWESLNAQTGTLIDIFDWVCYRGKDFYESTFRRDGMDVFSIIPGLDPYKLKSFERPFLLLWSIAQNHHAPVIVPLRDVRMDSVEVLDRFREVLSALETGGLKGVAKRIEFETWIKLPTKLTSPSPDVFISYAHENANCARIAQKLIANSGATAWYDQGLRLGNHFPSELATNIRESRAVIVLWSEASVKSKFVYMEAKVAVKKNKYVPILIDKKAGPRIPPYFGQYQYIEIEDLNTHVGAPDWQEVLGEIKRCFLSGSAINTLDENIPSALKYAKFALYDPSASYKYLDKAARKVSSWINTNPGHELQENANEIHVRLISRIQKN